MAAPAASAWHYHSTYPIKYALMLRDAVRAAYRSLLASCKSCAGCSTRRTFLTTTTFGAAGCQSKGLRRVCAQPCANGARHERRHSDRSARKCLRRGAQVYLPQRRKSHQIDDVTCAAAHMPYALLLLRVAHSRGQSVQIDHDHVVAHNLRATWSLSNLAIELRLPCTTFGAHGSAWRSSAHGMPHHRTETPCISTALRGIANRLQHVLSALEETP